MSITDYVIDILLIAVIFRQVRPHQLTASALALPLVLLITGNALGVISGLGDRLWRDGRGTLIARAAALSVVAWVVGMGFRFAFAYYGYHSGGPSIARFSLRRFQARSAAGGQLTSTASHGLIVKGHRP